MSASLATVSYIAAIILLAGTFIDVSPAILLLTPVFLPAVVQVLAAQVVVEQVGAAPLRLQRLERAKFLKQVRPEQTLRVSCRERQHCGRLVWDAHLEADGEPAAAFLMTLVEESEA